MKPLNFRLQPPVILATLSLLIIVLSAAGYWYYERQWNELQKSMRTELLAIADVKASQIHDWMHERMNDAEFIFNDPAVADGAAQLRMNPRSESARRAIQTWMQAMYRNRNYHRIALFTLGGVELASANGDSIHSLKRFLLDSALQIQRPVMSDFFLERDGDAWLSIMVPILAETPRTRECVAAVQLDIDPREKFYPLLHAWLTSRGTAEMIMVRKESDSVFILNGIRNRKNGILTMRLRASQNQSPAAMAVRGVEGTVEGVDYRGVKVMAAIQRVPDSPWYLVAKIDADEVLRSARERAILLFTAIVLSSLLVGMGAIRVTKEGRRQYEMLKKASERERLLLLQHFDYLVKYANDIIILADEQLHIVEVNDRALEAFGYSREEMLKLTLRDTAGQAHLAGVDDRVKLIRASRGNRFEIMQRRKDGTEFPAEISARMITIEGKEYVQGIVRDITERKQQEEAVLRLHRFYRVLSDINQMVVREKDPLTLMRHACRITVEEGRLMLAWIGTLEEQTSTVKPVAWAGHEKGYLSAITIKTENDPTAQGPVALALKERRRIIVNVEDDPGMAPTREEALKRGYRSLAALPLMKAEKLIGVLAVYAPQPDYFGPEEVQLMDELALDVSYALDNLQNEDLRKQAEAALSKSEHRYRTLFKNMLDGFAYHEIICNESGTPIDFRFLDVSPAFERMTGLRAAEILGKTAREVMPDIDEQWITMFGEAALKGTNVHFEQHVPSFGKWLEVTAYQIEHCAFATLFKDITDSVESRRQEKLFTDAMTASTDEIYMFDTDTWRFSFVNHGALSNLGYSMETLKHMTPLDLKPEFTRESFAQLVAPLLNHEKDALTFATVHRRADGSTYPVEVHLQLFEHDHEKVFLGVIQDITERRRSSDALRESEGRYRRLVEFSPDAIVVHAEGKVVYVNSAAVKLFRSSSKEQLVGMPVLDLVHPSFHPVVKERVWHATKDQAEVPLIEEKFIGLDGSEINVEVAAIPIVYDGRQAMQAVVRDISERKLAEAAIRESEERYRKLISASPDGIAIIDRNGKLAFVSPTLLKMHGDPPREEVIGHSPLEWVADEDKERAAQNIADAFHRRHAEKRHYKLQRADGTWFWGEIKSAPLEGSDGSPIGLISITRDITDRMHVAQALRESEEKYRSLFESNPHSMWVYDEETLTFLAVNDAAIRQYGYSREEFLSMTSRDIRPSEDIELFERFIHTTPGTLRTGGPLRHKKKDGGVIYVEVASHSIAFEGKKARLVMATNVTEVRRKEEERRKLLHAIEQSPVSIVITDTDGNIEYVNAKFQQVTGYSLQEVIGKNPRLLQSGSTKPEEYKAMWNTIASGNDWQGMFHNKKKSGELFWESVSISPVRNTDGAITHYVAVKEDVTEQRAMEERVLRSQRLESLGVLAGGIAHDLNNVLAPVLVSIEILKKKFPDSQSAKLIDAVERSARRGKDVVKQVLTFARGMGGERLLVQPKHIIREIESLIKETFPRNIEVRADVPSDLQTILADATQIHQILMNVCVNARDAMPVGGTLLIKAENVTLGEEVASFHLGSKPGRYVKISVKDTGTGMPNHILGKIFDPFFTTKEPGKGTGLGLSTVYTLVKTHDGFVDVESVVDHGSSFHIYFPVYEDGEAVVEVKEQAVIDIGSKTILVIDDEEAIREVVQVTLESHGHHVYVAADGTEAVALFGQKKDEIDLVITDLMMPFMDGAMTVRALRRMKPTVKIIAASGLMASDGISGPIENEVQAMLTKPFTTQALLEVVSQVLRA